MALSILLLVTGSRPHRFGMKAMRTRPQNNHLYSSGARNFLFSHMSHVENLLFLLR